MKKTLLITLTILMFSLMLLAQPADQKPMNKMMMNNESHMMMGSDGQGMNMMNNMMQELKLTPEQKRKMEVMKDDQQKFMNTKKAEMKNLQIDKMSAMQAGDYNRAKQINRNITDLQLVIENAKVDHKAEMMKELTPEQREKMKSMMMDKMPMMNRMMKQKMMNKGMMNGSMMNDSDDSCPGNCECR